MAVPNPLPRLTDGLDVGKGSDITNGGGGFSLTLPEWMHFIDEALDEQVIRFDLTNVGDVTFAAASYSGGIATGGNFAANGFRVTQSLGTMTADVDATDPSIGTPYLFEYNFTAHAGDTVGLGAIGPQVMSGYRGPRAAFAFEGVGYWPENMKVYSPDPMAFGDFHTERLPGSAAADRNAQFSWSFLSARYRIADGHKWTVLNNDTRSGPIPFFDNQVWVTGNGGEFDGTTNTPVYPIGDNYTEHDLEDGTWIASFSAGIHIYGNAEFTGYAMFAGHDANTSLTNPTGGTFIELGEAAISGALTIDASTTYPIQTQIMFYSPRLFAGARNLAALFNSPVGLWEDTNTFTALSDPVVSLTGSHTYDYTSPTQTAINLGGTWSYADAAHALGGFTGINLHPTLQNTAALSGTMFAFNFLLAVSPTYKAVTNTIDLTTIRQVYSVAQLQRTGGGVLTIGELTDFYSSATTATGCGILQKFGLHVDDITGTGTCLTHVGIRIEALAFATTNIGIQNYSTSRLVNKVTVGSDADGTYILNVRGGNSSTNALGVQSSTTGPATPGSTTTAAIQHYVGSGGNHYLLVAYNDSGTVRYRYMPLNGTTVTWTHSTTLPT